MNLNLARPQEQSQAGSEPSLHGWARPGLGPASLLGSGFNRGASADPLILDRGRRTSLPADPRGPLAPDPECCHPPSWMPGSPPCSVRRLQCPFQESSLFAQVSHSFYYVLLRNPICSPTLVHVKDGHWCHLSLPQKGSIFMMVELQNLQQAWGTWACPEAQQHC